MLEKNWLNENLLHFPIPDKFPRLAEDYYELDILFRKLCLLGPNNPYGQSNKRIELLLSQEGANLSFGHAHLTLSNYLIMQ